MEPFFLLVAARRVARRLLYLSYTARFHPGMQTAEQSIASATARRRNQKKVPNFKTLTGEVRRGLKVGTFFFARCCGAFLNRFLVALSSRGVRTTARA